MFPMGTARAIGADTNTSSAWMQGRHLGRLRSVWVPCARNTQWTELSPTQQLPSRGELRFESENGAYMLGLLGVWGQVS